MDAAVSERLFQRLYRHPAGAQQGGRAVKAEDGGFHPHRAGPAIDHRRDAARQPGQNMRGARGRHFARRIGRRRGQRPAEGA
jgi:hypothetical protein